MRRIYYWTGGQPYLTQSLCRAVAEDLQVVDATGVDRICQSLFFTGGAAPRTRTSSSSAATS